jgi:hypothetical protein
MARLLRHLGFAERRSPALRADTDRVTRHLAHGTSRIVGRLLVRVIKEAHRRHVDNDTVALGVRQDRVRGQVNRRALARQPLIDAGIGATHFLVTEAVLPPDHRECVFVTREDPRFQWLEARRARIRSRRQCDDHGLGHRLGRRLE